MSNPSGRRGDESDEGLIEVVGRRAAQLEIRDVFIRLGIDFDKPEDIRRWHDNRQWIEEKRTGEERMKTERRKLVWGGVVTLIAGALLSASTGLGRFMLVHFFGAKP